MMHDGWGMGWGWADSEASACSSLCSLSLTLRTVAEKREVDFNAASQIAHEKLPIFLLQP